MSLPVIQPASAAAEVSERAISPASVPTKVPAAPRPSRPPISDDMAGQLLMERMQHARLIEWAEQVQQNPGAFLVARPLPEYPNFGFPSPAAAYREVAELIEAL